MTHLFNDSTKFADELVAGFVAANRNWVRQVNGGVIRRHKAKPGQVVVVVGGGSGHYPAFGGIVGQGLAHGAAMGNVFASPSAQQIYNVAKAVEVGGGILFTYGNYAGDVLNFNQAQDRLRAEGIDVRTVAVTDDIASASIEEKHKRRGIAGDLPVFKAAAVAADSGASLDEVFKIATEANERTRTIGVAFSGCTLPGATEPLFTVEKGKMEVGMGIHGEPGLYQLDVPSADGLAEILVEKLLTEVPAGVNLKTARVGVMLNGLGTIKYEELFVVYRKVDELLTKNGLTVVDPEVGELVTSFDMAGVSLTLFWLNYELEQTWLAAADTPAFKKGSIAASSLEEVDEAALAAKKVFSAGSPESQSVAKVVFEALQAAKATVDEHFDELGRMDAIAGDGDHGIGMQRGVSAAVDAAAEALAAGVGAGSLLAVAGDAWSDRAGGTSGALWGVILRKVGNSFGDQVCPTSSVIAAGISSALMGVTNFGKAQVGDKTMVDTLDPFASSLSAAAIEGKSATEAWSCSTRVAEDSARATANLLPKIGRARPHAEKSVGTADPGAYSMALIIRAIEKVLVKHYG